MNTTDASKTTETRTIDPETERAEIVADDHPSAYGGPAGDGSFTYRTRKLADATRFAAGQLYYGKPAKVNLYEASRATARRWGLA